MSGETKMMLEFLHSECNRGGCDTCPFNTIAETEYCPLEDTEGVEKAFEKWMDRRNYTMMPAIEDIKAKIEQIDEYNYPKADRTFSKFKSIVLEILEGGNE